MPLQELGEEAVSSFIARIDAPIRQMVTLTLHFVG